MKGLTRQWPHQFAMHVVTKCRPLPNAVSDRVPVNHPTGPSQVVARLLLGFLLLGCAVTLGPMVAAAAQAVPPESTCPPAASRREGIVATLASFGQATSCVIHRHPCHVCQVWDPQSDVSLGGLHADQRFAAGVGWVTKLGRDCTPERRRGGVQRCCLFSDVIEIN
eukprot:SAG22_NODE_8_length_37215_cov_120.960351_17_plen_166_part_00